MQKRAFLAVLAGMVMGLLGCQDYPFEEVIASRFNMVTDLKCVTVTKEVDILFVVDNSGSMAGEQIQLAESFMLLAGSLNDYFGEEKYRIAIVTTGIESPGCWPCDSVITGGCINESGESGRFQDYLGHITWLNDFPDFDFTKQESCRIVTSNNNECFYDEADGYGTVLVGTTGCGYERGLEAMRRALDDNLRYSYNDGFLRDEATLVVVIVSDEEDCGQVGDVTETIPSAQARTCYYAAKGIGPDGSAFHPDDPDRRPYRLTPVEEYYKFLVDRKGGRADMIKFAAIVGMQDPQNPSATTIEYLTDDPNSPIANACTTPNCQGQYCEAKPGTRYIKLAQMFGNRGFADTICQSDFSDTMGKLETLVRCPNYFKLDFNVFDPDLIAIQLDGEAVPRFTCEHSLAKCSGPGDEACAPYECLPTWTLEPSISDQGNPTIRVGEHYDPCAFVDSGEVCLELFYVPE